jgi:transmembrane protein TMEM43
MAMDADSYTEYGGRSWGSRLIESIKGILLGFVMFIVAFPVLFWNEGRAVQTAKSLEEGASEVASVTADSVEATNQGKLVYVTGDATTTDTLSDHEFGVTVSALRLERVAEMYQWKESKNSHSEKKLGGGQTTVTTYKYEKVWSPKLINSGVFKQASGHDNPQTMPVKNETWTAKSVTLGSFTLPEALIDKMDKTESYAADETAASNSAPDVQSRFNLHQGGYYLGENPASPAIGDTRITFKVVRPATVSIVARQVESTFEAYQAKAGGSILLLTYGTVSPDAMFKTAEKSNKNLTWILRAAGFLLMFIGLYLIFNPLAVVADVLPIFGSLLRAGVAGFVGLVASALSLVTISVAWLTYRPLLGIALLVLAAASMWGLLRLSVQKHELQKKPA